MKVLVVYYSQQLTLIHKQVHKLYALKAIVQVFDAKLGKKNETNSPAYRQSIHHIFALSVMLSIHCQTTAVRRLQSVNKANYLLKGVS